MHEYHIKEIKKVVDGDTIDVVLDLGFGIFKNERMRLEGIDAPESITSDPQEKAFGMESKAFLVEWLGKQTELRCKTTKDDKYGRTLARIWGDGQMSINEEMVTLGYAWTYDGTKAKEKNFALLLERRGSGASE